MLSREIIGANILKNILEEKRLHLTAEYIAKEISTQAVSRAEPNSKWVLALFPDGKYTRRIGELTLLQSQPKSQDH